MKSNWVTKLNTTFKNNKVAGKFIGSGLLKTAAHTLSGFIVLRWLEPESLGTWQSFTIFVGYLQILTLGVTSGLNRELPYWLGKGNLDLGIERLKTAGYFITALSVGLMVVTSIVAVIFFALDVFNLDHTLMMILTCSLGSLSIQTSFLMSTFRANRSFEQLSKIELYNSLLYFVLIPLVYYFGLWGYITYQIILAFVLFLGYRMFKPYKVAYCFSKYQLIELIKVGFPMYFWNYIATFSRSIPTLILVLFGGPLLVGLYAPAASVNAAMFSLPSYVNQYLFPQMSYRFGKDNNANEIYSYTIKAASYLFSIMIFGGIIATLLIPYVFPVFFPKYIESILVAQIVVFSGVFYSINSLLHNALNSVKSFKSFKFIVGFRYFYIFGLTAVAYWALKDLLLSVAIGAVVTEMLNMLSYFYYLGKIRSGN